MIDWLKSLFCLHKYKIIYSIEHFTREKDGGESVLGYTFTQQCTKCGRLIKKRIKADGF